MFILIYLKYPLTCYRLYNISIKIFGNKLLTQTQWPTPNMGKVIFYPNYSGNYLSFDV